MTAAGAAVIMYLILLVVLHPVVDLGLGQALNILNGVRRCLAAAEVQEVQAAGGLEQSLLIAGRIAKITVSALLDQGSGFGIVFLLADDLLQSYFLLLSIVSGVIIHNFIQKSREIFGKARRNPDFPKPGQENPGISGIKLCKLTKENGICSENFVIPGNQGRFTP